MKLAHPIAIPLAAMLALIAVSDLNLILNRPSYGVLLWTHLLSPLAYLAGALLYVGIKPRSHQ